MNRFYRFARSYNRKITLLDRQTNRIFSLWWRGNTIKLQVMEQGTDIVVMVEEWPEQDTPDLFQFGAWQWENVLCVVNDLFRDEASHVTTQ